MSDTPIEVPTDVETSNHRPRATVQRDLTVMKLLKERPHNRHELDAALGTGWRVTYGALCRLRHKELVALQRTGTRTPVWVLTEAGLEWYTGAAPTVEEGRPPAPEPTGFQTV